MPALNADLLVVETPLPRHPANSTAHWMSMTCTECGPSTFLIVAASADSIQQADGRLVFLRCVRCTRGVVVNRGVVSPGASSLPAVDGCPADVEAAWAEVRAALGVRATTSAVMMCRKLLFHIAVEKGLPAKGDKGRAPSFEQCLAHLRAEGLLTPPLEPWVQHIKDIGNTANHDLAAITPEEAERVATFTRQLLVTTYEMPHKMKAVLDEPPGGAGTLRV
jgi:hypothetical protein